MALKRNKEMQGTVARRSGDKTVAVLVTRVERHPVYEKRRMRSKTYLTHDPKNELKIGDEVVIREVRPLSARKRWMVVSK